MDNKIVIKLFIERVASGTMTMDDVPPDFKAEVQEAVDAKNTESN